LPKPHPSVRLAMSAFLVLVLVFLAACQQDAKKNLEEFDPNEPVKLKIIHYSEDDFYQKYGDLLLQKFPNIEFEIIPYKFTTMTLKDQLEPINTEKPDIFYLTSALYEELSAEGRLMELDPFIQQDQFDTGGIYSAVIDQLREGGNGKLYGLAPEFISNAIYYNADLFRKYGVELPTDRMSWDEILKLAQRFPSDGSEEERVYGFKEGSANGLYDLVMNVGNTMGLSPVSSDGLNLVIQSESWRKVFESVMQAYQSGSLLVTKGSTNSELIRNDIIDSSDDKFAKGQVAMRLETFIYYSRTLNDNRNVHPFELGVVTIPVNPATPDTTHALNLSSIYAINSQTAHKGAAWEVVKYINSEEVAKVHSRTAHTQTPSRKEYAKAFGEFNIEPFYALKTPSRRWSDQTFFLEFSSVLRPLVTNELLQVADDKKSLDEAIETIQTEGQQLLDSLRMELSETVTPTPETPK